MIKDRNYATGNTIKQGLFALGYLAYGKKNGLVLFGNSRVKTTIEEGGLITIISDPHVIDNVTLREFYSVGNYGAIKGYSQGTILSTEKVGEKEFSIIYEKGK